MLTTDFVIYLALGLLGLCFGSFAGATVWRLRARQLVADRASGEDVDSKELKKLLPLTKVSFAKDRSKCLHCGYELRWYDLIPLVSWVSLKGRCRQCRHKIGNFEPIIEISMAAFFVASFLLWPLPLVESVAIAHFILWLIAGVLFGILFAYDAKWFLLPDVVNFSLVAVGVLVSAVVIIQAPDMFGAFLSVLASVGVMGGLYLLIYLVSKGNWVGFGDVKLGLGLGLLLADWQLAVVALFAANLVGSLVVLPGVISGKLRSKSQVPFGPLLIVGAIIGKLFGAAIIEFYFIVLL